MKRRAGEAAAYEAREHEQDPGQNVGMAIGGAVGVHAGEHHRDRAENAQRGEQEAGVGDAGMGDALDDGRRGETVGPIPRLDTEEEDADEPDAWVEKGGGDGLAVSMGRRCVALDGGEDGVALRAGEPGRVGGAVRQQEEEGDAEDNRRQAFDQEEPLPAAQAEMSLEPHQRAGERAHHDGADGKCNVEARDGAGAQMAPGTTAGCRR